MSNKNIDTKDLLQAVIALQEMAVGTLSVYEFMSLSVSICIYQTKLPPASMTDRQTT